MVRKKETIKILTAIYAERACGAKHPVQSSYEKSDGAISQEDWYLTARAAGFNIMKRGGEWFEGVDNGLPNTMLPIE